MLGEIRIPRGYYPCQHCHRGSFPWEETLGLSSRRLTPGAQEVVTLAGIGESFAKAADITLKKMSGLHLCESTVLRTTEAAGQRLGQALHEGEVFGPRAQWDWHRDAQGNRCAYVSVDATGVMMQGENGAKAEGRMAYVGMIYNPQPRTPGEQALSKPCEGVRYLAGHYTLEELGLQMRRQAAHVGMEAAEQWLVLTDGGSGLESWAERNFPGAQKILDFRHVTEYLSDLAKKFRSGEEAEALLGYWCHIMKHQGGKAVLGELNKLDRRRMKREARQEHQKTTRYIGNNLGRMDYPEYLRRGWQIATGAVESACKTVVNQRLNMGGMRWSEGGSDKVCHLRALYQSDPDQWDAFWGYTMAG